MKELMELLTEYNDGTKRLLAWFKEHMEDDQLFDTEDGQRLLLHSAEIAKASALLNLAAAKMALENVLLDSMLHEND